MDDCREVKGPISKQVSENISHKLNIGSCSYKKDYDTAWFCIFELWPQIVFQRVF